MIVASALFGVAAAEPSMNIVSKMNPLEKWKFNLDELAENGESSGSISKDDLREFSYLDGPYPALNDDGSIPGGSPLAQCMPFGSCYVSDVLSSPTHNVPVDYAAYAMGGDFLVGDVHEYYIGDQNDNGILEWVVYFVYFPWYSDDIDNDGDGCVDEKKGGLWPGGPCDAVPDAAVIYETGGLPDLGGNNADLFVNLDWFSGIENVEIYRAFASPRWSAYRVRSVIYYPQIAGEFISYYSFEGINDVNSNPEMDNDRHDWYVGSIDARRFPVVAPVNNICSAGYQLPEGSTFPRYDGWVVTSYELREYYDDHDWNGDGDIKDSLAAYYAVDPLTGNCRLNVVNTGVYAAHIRNTGLVITPYYVPESGDNRDWNSDGDTYDNLQLYHDINSTWSMKGRAYTSFTFTAQVPEWGFGWWALFNDALSGDVHPLSFGGSYRKYLSSMQGYYHTYFFLTSDEDGDRHTKLPGYHITYGSPAGILAGRCIVIYAYEYHLEYANVDLIGYIADGNGDKDTYDTLGLIYCPDKSDGGGQYVVEATSKYAKGMYSKPIPYLWLGHVLYPGTLEFNGYASVVIVRTEIELSDDCDGDLVLNTVSCHAFYTVAVPPLGDGGQGQMPKGHLIDGREPLHNHESLRIRTMEGVERQ